MMGMCTGGRIENAQEINGRAKTSQINFLNLCTANRSSFVDQPLALKVK